MDHHPPSSSRRILPPKTLGAFGATPLYLTLRSQVGGSFRSASPAGHRGQSSRTHPPARSYLAPTPSPQGVALASVKEILPNGIMIGGWKIATQNSAIGDEKRMEELTLLLEETANNDDGMADQGSTERNRRLCPPEIAFLDAFASFHYQKYSSDLVDGSGKDWTEIRFTAQGALLEWAEAHRFMGMEHDHNEDLPTSRDEFRGVSILRTADAKIWSDKPQIVDVITGATYGNSEFHYDWTFSSPYAGTIRCSHTKENAVDAGHRYDINNRKKWHSLHQSHIPFHLLQDTSQPILFYDDIHLYEDDLHDNGDVSLNVKIRVMPRCWYVLQQLFVRVDRMCVRCREVRYFCLFDGGHNNETDIRVNKIYRDIEWREATWDELGKLRLPLDPADWRESGNIGGAVAGVRAPPPLASLLTRLPVVPLPKDLPRFSYYDVSE